MDLSPGTRLASYEIVAPLGAGAMGEVYRARDTTLGRDVAIKLLPEAFTSDEERLARFDREARLLAQLNHPGIAGIHGIETTETGRFIVMEFVPGGTLSERMANGPMAWKSALELARQMADALEAAHESGIVHRDLKPDNVAVTPDDTVKLLDFGIGKPVGEDAERVIGTSSGMTQTGVVLGTPAYISPEQMRGKPVDRRADIWAFGCLLYEMLTGSRAFAGDTVGEIAAAVLTGEPDWSALPADTPSPLQTLVRRCLERDPRQRQRDMGDARLAIERMLAGPLDAPAAGVDAGVPPDTAPGSRWTWPIMIAGAAIAMAVMAVSMRAPQSPAESEATRPGTTDREVRFQIEIPEGKELLRMTVAPNGSAIALVLRDLKTAKSAIWLRKLNDSNLPLKPLDETEGASEDTICFAPSGDALAFVVGGKLCRLDLVSAEDTTLTTRTPLCQVDRPIGPASWSVKDEILFNNRHDQALSLISARGGGTLQTATKLSRENRESRHGAPTWLGDGSGFLAVVRYYSSQGRDAVRRKRNLVYFSPDGGEPPTIVCPAEGSGWPVGDWLLYRSGPKIVARSFDAVSATVKGDELLVASCGLGTMLPPAASTNGVVVFQEAGKLDTELAWVTLSGEETVLGAQTAEFFDARPSPVGDRIAVVKQSGESSDIWVLDSVGRNETRLTDGEDGYSPVWSPSGERIAYAATSDEGGYRIYVRLADGSGDPVEIDDCADVVCDWSKDGWLSYKRLSTEEGAEEFIRFRYIGTGAADPPPVLPDSLHPDRDLMERDAFGVCFSPDGQWIVYFAGDEPDTTVYVRRFVQGFGSGRLPISAGSFPDWSPSKDANEIIFYRKETPSAWRVRLEPDGKGGDDLGALEPVKLFEFPQYAWNSGFSYSHDGKRILCTRRPPPNDKPVTVIVNWQPEK